MSKTDQHSTSQVETSQEEMAPLEELLREVQSRPKDEQRDICLIVQGYLTCRASMGTVKK